MPVLDVSKICYFSSHGGNYGLSAQHISSSDQFECFMMLDM